MKRLFVLLVLVLVSCTPEPPQDCGKIDVKVYYNSEHYFKINGEKITPSLADWEKYRMGDTYCK